MGSDAQREPAAPSADGASGAASSDAAVFPDPLSRGSVGATIGAIVRASSAVDRARVEADAGLIYDAPVRRMRVGRERMEQPRAEPDPTRQGAGGRSGEPARAAAGALAAGSADARAGHTRSRPARAGGSGARGQKRRLLVVSNRLPLRRARRAGETQWQRSSGGLVSALFPILQARGGTWVGWSGVAGRTPEPFEQEGVRYGLVGMTGAEVDAFYHGFSNRTLWPLYHDAARTPEFNRNWWGPYREVNRRFAEACAAELADGDDAWVHDYHLQLVPALLRELRPDTRIGFFLHIPFPPVELFGHLPWREQILEGLLGADVIGFQTRGGVQNFLRCVRRFTRARVSGSEIRHGGRTVRASTFPISIDFETHAELAASPAVERKLHALEKRMAGRRVLLGVDRLDYTKGIDVRLTAFEALLERRPEAARQLVFIQVAVPSREDVKDYATMRADIERAVGRINGRYGQPGLMPIQYLYRSISPEELSAYYRAADVMLVTPLRDGMGRKRRAARR
jgi:trehalose 6-phosphate synthase